LETTRKNSKMEKNHLERDGGAAREPKKKKKEKKEEVSANFNNVES